MYWFLQVENAMLSFFDIRTVVGKLHWKHAHFGTQNDAQKTLSECSFLGHKKKAKPAAFGQAGNMDLGPMGGDDGKRLAFPFYIR